MMSKYMKITPDQWEGLQNDLSYMKSAVAELQGIEGPWPEEEEELLTLEGVLEGLKKREAERIEAQGRGQFSRPSKHDLTCPYDDCQGEEYHAETELDFYEDPALDDVAVSYEMAYEEAKENLEYAHNLLAEQAEELKRANDAIVDYRLALARAVTIEANYELALARLESYERLEREGKFEATPPIDPEDPVLSMFTYSPKATGEDYQRNEAAREARNSLPSMDWGLDMPWGVRKPMLITLVDGPPGLELGPFVLTTPEERDGIAHAWDEEGEIEDHYLDHIEELEDELERVAYSNESVVAENKALMAQLGGLEKNIKDIESNWDQAKDRYRERTGLLEGALISRNKEIESLRLRLEPFIGEDDEESIQTDEESIQTEVISGWATNWDKLVEGGPE